MELNPGPVFLYIDSSSNVVLNQRLKMLSVKILIHFGFTHYSLELIKQNFYKHFQIKESSPSRASLHCEADIYAIANVPLMLPYRMLAHSHSATSLYNLSQFKPISDQFTSIVYVVPASNLRTGVVWPRFLP